MKIGFFCIENENSDETYKMYWLVVWKIKIPKNFKFFMNFDVDKGEHFH
jgi:hypothetical protein